jgi:hypothetical protein
LSSVLTGNNLGQLGNADSLPSLTEIEDFKKSEFIKTILQSSKSGEEVTNLLHLSAKKLLEEGNIPDAWKTLLSAPH